MAQEVGDRHYCSIRLALRLRHVYRSCRKPSWVRSHGASYDSTLDVNVVATSEASPVQKAMDG